MEQPVIIEQMPDYEAQFYKRLLYKRNKRMHLAKDEFLFAADWEYQTAQWYEKQANWKQAQSHYIEAARLVQRENKKQPAERYFLKTMGRFYSLKVEELNEQIGAGDAMTPAKRLFLQHVEKIQKALNSMERCQVNLRCLLQAGRSLRRLHIRNFYNQRILAHSSRWECSSSLW